MISAGRNFVVVAYIVFGMCLSTLAGATQTLEESPRGTVSPIVNGTVPNSSKPWIASLVANVEPTRPQASYHNCGGTLVDAFWIVTAAHCVYGTKPDDLKVIIGRQNLNDGTGEAILVTQIISYPDYQNAGPYADIALLRLAHASSQTPLAIISSTDEKRLEGKLLTAFGWGRNNGTRRPDCEVVVPYPYVNTEGFTCDAFFYSPSVHPSTLMSAELTLATTIECNAKYREVLTALGRPTLDIPTDFTPYPNELCAWDRANVTSLCYGDSGGPLVGTIDGKQYLVGIVSRGLAPSCQTYDQIGVFTQVSRFSNFITESKGNSLALSFETFCPPEVTPSVSYALQADGNSRVTVSWDDNDVNTSAYRLYHTRLPKQGSFVGNIDIAAPVDEFSITLASGLKFMVALQALSSKCDGPVSEPVVVSVP